MWETDYFDILRSRDKKCTQGPCQSQGRAALADSVSVQGHFVCLLNR